MLHHNSGNVRLTIFRIAFCRGLEFFGLEEAQYFFVVLISLQ